MVSALVAFLLVGSPEHFYSVAGPVELYPASDEVAVEVQDQQAFARALSRHPGVTTDRVYGRSTVVSGAAHPEVLAQELAAAGSAGRLLAVYHASGTGERLIADGKIRARFATDLALGEVEARAIAAGAAGARLLRPGEGLYEILAPTPQDTVGIAARLQESGAAVWAHPDFIRRFRPLLIPSDTYYAKQWHHQLIDSEAAWDLERGKPNVIIAVIDSGLDMTHEDFKDKVVFPHDSWADGQTNPDGSPYTDHDPTPTNDDAHGTATAGLAAAATNNAIGIAGVCAGCSLMPIRMMSNDGGGRDSAPVDAFYWAADHGAQVISNSWGPMGAADVMPALGDAIKYAAAKTKNSDGVVTGSVILFAAGNEYRKNEWFEMASMPEVLGIGATGQYDEHKDYSNFGYELDLSAPAASVSADISGNAGYNPSNNDVLSDTDYVSTFDGTSAACPVAAGVAGLVFSVNPSFKRQQVADILMMTADKVGSESYDQSGFNPYYGYGRVNSLRAVQMALTNPTCTPVNEICDNGIDDDCDALIDAQDPACAKPLAAIGSECSDDPDCGTGGACLPPDYFPGGFCTTGCTSGSCRGDTTCVEIGYYTPVCLTNCERVNDCRDGYTCWPQGICLPACTSASDCQNGKQCNEYGLCGTDKPPVVDTPAPPPPPPAGSGGECACDTTTACDQDGNADCLCDPECKGGCAAVPPSLLATLLGLTLLVRRRRRH